ncbi:MAG: bifunctional enoyl-CoA hydratase/phosphate acetyltransferase, partial [Pseudomonadota bacterium]
MHIENKTLEDLDLGQTAALRRLCTQDDLLIFANMSGNHNPVHIFDVDGDGDGTAEALIPGMLLGALISSVLGNLLPGAGTVYRAQSLVFHEPAYAGDELLAQVEVTEISGEDRLVTLATEVVRPSDGVRIASGVAEVVAPAVKLSYDSADLPGLVVQRHRHFEELLHKAAPLPALRTAVVCPEEPNALGGALIARAHTLIEPILIGARSKIEAAAADIGADLSGLDIRDIADHDAAARAGVALVRDGRADALMKGHLHTDQLLRPVLDKSTGLRTGRRLTHIFVMDVPGLAHPLLVSDAAINILPDLKTKVDIVQNAIDLARSIGIAEPKVGVLSAVETVNPDLPSSVDAALLSKMADRGQITGGVVDGPLAMDNAVDMTAARTKGIASPVAGRAEVLVVPSLDAGNMLAKQLIYLSHAEG